MWRRAGPSARVSREKVPSVRDTTQGNGRGLAENIHFRGAASCRSSALRPGGRDGTDGSLVICPPHTYRHPSAHQATVQEITRELQLWPPRPHPGHSSPLVRTSRISRPGPQPPSRAGCRCPQPVSWKSAPGPKHERHRQPIGRRVQGRPPCMQASRWSAVPATCLAGTVCLVM